LGVLLLLLSSGCAGSADPIAPSPAGGKYGSGVNTDLGDKQEAPQGTTAPAGHAPIGRGANGAPRYATPVPAGAPRVDDHPYAFDKGGTGRNSPYYLRSAPYPKLVLEMVSARGSEPEQAAIDYVVARLGEVVDKPDGIEIPPMKTFSPTKTTYNAGELGELEAKYMTRHSGMTGGEAVLHLLFVNGEDEGKPTILGSAYRAASIVVYIDRIEAVSDPITLTELAIQKTVILHEVGHNIGLLNWGYRSPRMHWDKTLTHSKNPESVMFGGVENGDTLQNLFNGPPPDTFDADDKADLADIRSGKIKPFGK
jgi:hypothetical protein